MGTPAAASSLHDTVRGQFDRLKRAEINQGNLLVRTAAPLGACRAQCTVEEELSAAERPQLAFTVVVGDQVAF